MKLLANAVRSHIRNGGGLSFPDAAKLLAGFGLPVIDWAEATLPPLDDELKAALRAAEDDEL